MKVLMFATVLLMAVGCKKGKDNGSPAPSGSLLRSVEWSDGMKAGVEYNADNLLSKINYTLNGVASSTVFNWQQKQLSIMYDTRFPGKTQFYYSGDRLTHSIYSSPEAMEDGYKLTYTYRADGKVEKLVLSTITEAGEEPDITSKYHYAANGDLKEVESSDGENAYSHTFEWSETISFDPLAFLNTGLEENYSYLNIPVLSSMKKYPTKVTRKVMYGDQPAEVDRIEENTLTIANQRIEKMQTKITMPSFPENNSSTTAVFKYQ